RRPDDERLPLSLQRGGMGALRLARRTDGGLAGGRRRGPQSIEPVTVAACMARLQREISITRPVPEQAPRRTGSEFSAEVGFKCLQSLPEQMRRSERHGQVPSRQNSWYSLSRKRALRY